MQALSKLWTVEYFFKQAMGDLQDLNPVHYVERYNIVNLTQGFVASLFYELMIDAYMTPAVLMADNVGDYSAGMGTWTAAQRQLDVIMTVGFDATDIGKMVVFRIDGDVYVGFISTVNSATSVVLTGHALPAADDDVNAVLMAASTGYESIIDLGTLTPPVMRLGQQARIVVVSSASSNVEALSYDEYRVWRPGKEPNKIVWSYLGDNLHIAKGSALTSYGTLSLMYPRVPMNVTADSDYLDLPDGPAISIAMEIVRRNYGNQRTVDRSKLAELVGAIYKQFGATAEVEEIKKKVESLL